MVPLEQDIFDFVDKRTQELSEEQKREEEARAKEKEKWDAERTAAYGTLAELASKKEIMQFLANKDLFRFAEEGQAGEYSVGVGSTGLLTVVYGSHVGTIPDEFKELPANISNVQFDIGKRLIRWVPGQETLDQFVNLAIKYALGMKNASNTIGSAKGEVVGDDPNAEF